MENEGSAAFESNEGMQNDFFSDNDLINQDTGEPISISGDNGQDGNHNAPPEEGNNQQPPQKNNQQGKGGSAVPAKPYEHRYFKDDGSYDVESAINFVKNNFSSNVSGVGRNIPINISQQQLPPQQGGEQKTGWEAEYEASKKYRDDLMKQRTGYRSYMEEAANKGYTGQAIIDYANDRIERDIVEEMTKYERKMYYEQRESDRKDAESRREEAENLPKSRANLAKAYEALGGLQNFNDLVFGQVVDNNGKKEANGYGTQFVQMLYEIATPGWEKIPEGKQAESINQWWTKFTAKESNLQMIINYSIAQLQLAHMPHIVKEARGAATTAEQQRARAGNIRHSSILRNQKAGGNNQQQAQMSVEQRIEAMPDFI